MKKILLSIFILVVSMGGAYAVACDSPGATDPSYSYAMCKPGYYLSGVQCVQCPGFGTVAGNSMDKNHGGIDACYISANTSFTDDTGSFKFSSKCNFEEDGLSDNVLLAIVQEYVVDSVGCADSYDEVTRNFNFTKQCSDYDKLDEFQLLTDLEDEIGLDASDNTHCLHDSGSIDHTDPLCYQTVGAMLEDIEYFMNL